MGLVTCSIIVLALITIFMSNLEEARIQAEKDEVTKKEQEKEEEEERRRLENEVNSHSLRLTRTQ